MQKRFCPSREMREKREKKDNESFGCLYLTSLTLYKYHNVITIKKYEGFQNLILIILLYDQLYLKKWIQA